MSLTYRVNWGEIDGTLFKKPCALVLKMDKDIPTFGKLLDIYMVNSYVHFYVNVLETFNYLEHFHCFAVRTSQKVIVRHEVLSSFLPHHVRTVPNKGSLCVVPHHHFTGV